MCGRYTNTAGPEELGEHFELQIQESAGTGRYNIAPSESVLTIVAAQKSGERPQARLQHWGLIPTWAKSRKVGYKLINARLESVAEKPMYADLIENSSRRALQLADGYYEWLKPEHRKAPRQAFHHQVDGGKPFAFAALWTPTRIDGQLIESCTMLTCDSSSNRVARAIHDRMPVILADKSAQEAWLDPTVGADEALSLCEPLSEARLTTRPANPAVNKSGMDDGHELLVMVTSDEPKRQLSLD
jgi:putative SOS response-associated peptidase YedK